jgi:hypothetical protein
MAGGFRHALAAARAEASSDEMVAGAWMRCCDFLAKSPL